MGKFLSVVHLGDQYLQISNWESNESSTDEDKDEKTAINSIKQLVGGNSKNLSLLVDKLVKKESDNVDGICFELNKQAIYGGYYNKAGSIITDAVMSDLQKAMKFYFKKKVKLATKLTYQHDGNLSGDFVGDGKAGTSFNLGPFAKRELLQNEIKDMLLSKFCEKGGKDGNITLSPLATLAANTVDGAGLPTYGGKDGNASAVKKTNDRHYPSGLTGKELFDDNGSNTDGTPDGGFLLSQAKKDPYGSTAVAFNSFDKATIVLKTIAATTKGTDDINETLLPVTKAQSIDSEDEAVQLQTRMAMDFNQFGDTLTRLLRREFLDKAEVLTHPKPKNPPKGWAPHLASEALYESREKNVTHEFFTSKKSGLSAVYKGIEDEAKARMASEMLLLTADPNYIADPSEARAALIKPSQRNKFRYAALIQQEKNKQIKLKYALEIKRKQQQIDILKRQAQIRASIFRDEIAVHELRHIMMDADKSVAVAMKKAAKGKDNFDDDKTTTTTKGGKTTTTDGETTTTTSTTTTSTTQTGGTTTSTLPRPGTPEHRQMCEVSGCMIPPSMMPNQIKAHCQRIGCL